MLIKHSITKSSSPSSPLIYETNFNHLFFICFVGNGSQFLTLGLGIITMALFGMFNVHR